MPRKLDYMWIQSDRSGPHYIYWSAAMSVFTLNGEKLTTIPLEQIYRTPQNALSVASTNKISSMTGVSENPQQMRTRVLKTNHSS